MEKILKRIILFFAWILIVGAILGVIAFGCYIVFFFYTAIANHHK